MNPNKAAAIIPGVVLLSCAFALVYWLSAGKSPIKSDLREPIKDYVPMVATPQNVGGESTVPPAGTTQQQGTTASLPTAPLSIQTPGTTAEPPQIPGAWTMFRGANSDNISTDPTPLATQWAPGMPKVLWSLDVGEGHAGVAILNSRVYMLDYDRAAQADVLRCLSLADGKQLWSYSYPVSIKRNHGMSRTIPAVTDKFVVTIGPKLQVVCADSKSGKLLWTKDLVKEFGSVVPPWYAGQCPLIDGNRLIIAPSGPKVLMVGIDCATGKVLWQTPNTNGWTMTHSSVTPATLLGKRTYIYCGSGGVAGVSASDGKQLWQTLDWKVRIANVPSPVPVPGNRIFFCGGYNAGSMMIQLSGSGSNIQIKPVYSLQPRIFGSDQQTPILYKGCIYGVIPGGQLVCLSLDGKQLWNSGADRFGLGPYVAAGGRLFLLADRGILSLVNLSPNGYKKLAQAQVLTGSDAWAPIAVAGGRMIMRDLTRLVCLDMSGK